MYSIKIELVEMKKMNSKYMNISFVVMQYLRHFHAANQIRLTELLPS